MDNKKFQKSTEIFYCENCHYFTSRKSHYNRHILTLKHKRIIMDNKMDNKKFQKGTENFYCNVCDYNTLRKSQYDRHITTLKHFQYQKVPKSTEKYQKSTEHFTCVCGKNYNFLSGLYKHKNKCPANSDIHDKNEDLIPKTKTNTNDNEIVKILLQENNDLKKLMLEQNIEFKNMVLDVCKKIQPTTNKQQFKSCKQP